MIRKRPLMVELRPYTVVIREKGRRAGYEVSWESVYLLGAAKAADARRADRLLRRKAGNSKRTSRCSGHAPEKTS